MKRSLPIFTLLAIAVLTATLVCAQSSTEPSAGSLPLFRANVEVVTLDAAVLNKKTGRPLGPFSQRDFLIYENGAQQRISSFTRDELPLSVVLLFDLTDSVRPVLTSLGNGALRALEHLKPQDEVAVMVYAASATLLQDFTTNRALAAAAISRASRMKSDEAAFFNEGLYQAAQQTSLSSNPTARRVIIWLTDNIPNFPSDDIRRRYGRSLKGKQLHTEKQTLDALFRAGPMVCALVQQSLISDRETILRNSHWAEYMLQRGQFPPGDVYRYAEQTGGEVAESNANRMPQKLADMIDSIRARYTIGYKPAASASGFHALRLRLAPETERRVGKVNVVAKKGYWR